MSPAAARSSSCEKRFWRSSPTLTNASYGLPAFRVHGQVVAGFAALKNHVSYLPHSGSVLPELRDEFAGYRGTKGSLHFPIDRPLPRPLVEKLIALRLR